MYVDPTGHAVISIILSILIGATIGGVYGGATATANGQNISIGIVSGIISGALMGAGAGVASLYVGPAILGQTAAVAGITYSPVAALAIGSGIAFGSGALAGATSDLITQSANTGAIYDWGSVLTSGIQGGIINTLGMFLGSLGGPTSRLEGALLSAIFGSVTSAISMTVDILRNNYSYPQNSVYYKHKLSKCFSNAR